LINELKQRQKFNQNTLYILKWLYNNKFKNSFTDDLLQLVIFHDNLDIMYWLLDVGLKFPNSGDIYFIEQIGKCNTVKLLEYFKSIGYIFTLQTMMQSVRCGKIKNIEWLIKNGYDWNQPNWDYWIYYMIYGGEDYTYDKIMLTWLLFKGCPFPKQPSTQRFTFLIKPVTKLINWANDKGYHSKCTQIDWHKACDISQINNLIELINWGKINSFDFNDDSLFDDNLNFARGSNLEEINLTNLCKSFPNALA
jgi:hypothetical protein